MNQWRPYNKYSAKKVILPDGEKFDSRRKYQRWNELLLLKRAGQITDLERQVKYRLVPSQKKDGRVLERGIDYVADFVYKDKTARPSSRTRKASARRSTSSSENSCCGSSASESAKYRSTRSSKGGRFNFSVYALLWVVYALTH